MAWKCKELRHDSKRPRGKADEGKGEARDERKDEDRDGIREGQRQGRMLVKGCGVEGTEG